MLALSGLLRRIADALERTPPADTTWCPIVRGACWRTRCEHYVHLTGTHPQSGALLDEYGCAFMWTPLLLIETAKETRQLSAAVESWRNEEVRGDERLRRVIAAAALRTGARAPTIEDKGHAIDDNPERKIDDGRRRPPRI